MNTEINGRNRQLTALSAWNPASAAQEWLNTVAGTELSAYHQFSRQADQFQESWKAFLYGFHIPGKQLQAADFERFRFPVPPAGTAGTPDAIPGFPAAMLPVGIVRRGLIFVQQKRPVFLKIMLCYRPFNLQNNTSSTPRSIILTWRLPKERSLPAGAERGGKNYHHQSFPGFYSRHLSKAVVNGRK